MVARTLPSVCDFEVENGTMDDTVESQKGSLLCDFTVVIPAQCRLLLDFIFHENKLLLLFV